MPFNWISSMGSNIVERARNPFLGTFAFVWLARNWELVFALFNFDKSYTLESKISFLTDRIKYDAFWPELFANVVWTFFILVLTYFLINIARFITNIFENRLTPFIYSISSEGKIVTKEKYDLRIKEIENLEEKLRIEKEKRIATEAEIERIETKERDRVLADLSAKKMDEIDSEFDSLEQKMIDKFGEELILEVLDKVMQAEQFREDTNEYKIANELAKADFLIFGLEDEPYFEFEINDAGKGLWKKLYK